MVGRIELVTPEHRQLMQRISEVHNPDLSWFYAARERQSVGEQALKSVWEGKARLKDVSVAVPVDYRSYVELGRFRNALILDELNRNPGSALSAFADEYRIGYFSPAE